MTTTPIAPAAETAPPERRSWSGARTLLLVLGVLLALTGAGSLAGGGVALWADGQRDDDGYLSAGPGRFATDTYAISASSLHIHVDGLDDVFGDDLLGQVRVQLRPTDASASLFVGIGPADDVAAYLERVSHDEVGDLDAAPAGVTYIRRAGDRPAAAPAAQTFWAASDSGPGPRTLTWPVAAGDWAVVIMNTDASAGVQADIDAGARVPILGAVSVIAFVTGGLFLAAGIAMIVAPVVTCGRRRQPLSAGTA
ncbi:hypothetical protein [Nonomuraea basaltis]|uniref:hypothetical protein n=1 Tax=Nonomuraea basaltis TaxID=2495887 RepID=UPI00110C6BFC|nr:hypothetical protein [Nonomuraea basaltis]TMR91426.1 hypothetical protein EJK15_50075 [Nonomuraea basaltis]